MKDKEQYTAEETGLVLSGGGFRGMAHIGVIRYLEEINLSPNYISGTSAGALVGAFYAGGYSSEEILDFFRNTNLFNPKNYAFGKGGLIEPLKFLPAMKKYFPEDRFEALQKNLFVARTNLQTGASEVVHRGKLLQNVMASAALPLMFAPVEIDDTLFADGGITNNFPVNCLLPFCKKIIGVYVNPLEMKKKQDFKHIHSVVERAFHISLAHSSMPKFSNCEVMIVPAELKDYSLMDLKHINEIVEIGYQAALLHKVRLSNMAS